ncbi:uncharacterized protein LOC122047611 isoform X1 [Zingiber officinale]|uniref:Uncharacterized protein n=2 Tax=Zingiber officinale TaxID=94328 RepID=A0A8J5LN87_ZINOF|nr:uncharacterized protein LOC122047611 isoform X1 [Zingiber officinale]KAG6526412.1 hypothetical protein ZIOFF_016396 [Zingiber officinale]
MPYKHRRRYSTIEKIAYGRNDSLLLQDLQPPELDPGSPKLMFRPITVIFVDNDALANASYLPSNMVSPDTSSPRLFLINLDTDFRMSSSSGSGSEASSSGQGKKNLSSSVSSTSGNASPISDNTNVVSSDFLVGLFPKEENKAKRKSRKKDQKKRKQRKRVTSTRDPNKSVVQCNAKMPMTSAFETSAPSSLCSSDKHLPGSNLSDEVAVSLLDKDDSANTNKFVDCPNSLLSTSFSDEIDDFETVPSSERSSDDLHWTTTTWLHSSGNFKNEEALPFSFDGGNGGENCKENNICDGNSPMDKTNNDMSENTSDDTVIELPVKDETGPSSSEVPKDPHSYAACFSNNVLDAYCGTGRADYIIQDDSSNGFHVVISGKRRRRARRRMNNGALNGENMPINANIHSNMEKDYNYSIWPKLQKFGEECSKPNRVKVSSSHSKLAMKDDKMKSEDRKFIEPKKKQSGITPCSGGNSKIEASLVASRESKASVTITKSTVGNSVTGVMCESNSIAKQAEHNDWNVTCTAKADVPNGIQQREGLQNPQPVQLNIQSKTGSKSPGNEVSGRCVSKLTDNELEKRVPVPTEEFFCHNKLSYIPTTTNQLGQGKIETISVSDTKMNSEDTVGSIVGNEGQELIKPCFGSYKESNNLNSISTSTQNRIPVVTRTSADINKIMIALNDVCKQQRVVEYAQLMIGYPIADFEKFLFSASPIIRQTEGQNISLKNIWKWYEEPGCFGLEVSGQEFCDSRRLPNGYLDFTAYFVPYLSAVQLFGMSVSSRNCNLNSQVDQTDKSSKSLGSHSTLTLMLQNSCKSADVCLSDFSSEGDLSDKNTPVNQADLIFEYFESDLPPRRPPLFDKTNELMAGDTASDGCIFGNPSVLESIELQDLHPASWYCVAWYPIYRIPIGRLRAAFLTYHSLGNFTRAGNPADSPGACDTLVSPVVGLQSYNDMGENWFRPRNMGSNVPCTNPSTSELVKERLRALRQTAAAMSGTIVSKGDSRSVNRHRDYEFFVSRSR